LLCWISKLVVVFDARCYFRIEIINGYVFLYSTKIIKNCIDDLIHSIRRRDLFSPPPLFLSGIKDRMSPPLLQYSLSQRLIDETLSAEVKELLL